MFPEESEVAQGSQPEVDLASGPEISAPEVANVIEAQEPDTLSQIEERILRAVELVNTLRQERDAALRDLGEVRGERQQAETAGRALSEEVLSLKAERKQVRSRLERLLGHIDQLS